MYTVTIKTFNDNSRTQVSIDPRLVENSTDPMRNAILEAIKHEFGEDALFLFDDDRSNVKTRLHWPGEIAFVSDEGAMSILGRAVCRVDDMTQSLALSDSPDQLTMLSRMAHANAEGLKAVYQSFQGELS